MSSLASSPPSPGLSDRQKAALIKLLSDDDAAVYQTVRDRILACGQEAVDWLKPHTLSGDPVLRRRCVELLRHLGRQTADNDFLAFCLRHGEEMDLEQGVWLLARTEHPEINMAGYQALFDDFAAELRQRLDHSKPALSLLATINQYLFDELGFTGNEQNYYDPENSYLNSVVDRRMGNPISLCIVYLMVTRRLRLPVTGIGLPGHFICRFQNTRDELYIDAFHHGRLLTRADCVKYLVQARPGFQDGALTPVSNRRMMVRACSNLHQIYQQLDLADEAARMQRYLVILSR